MKHRILIILLSIFGQNLFAQQDTGQKYSVDIYTVYSPVLAHAQKMVVRPMLEPMTSTPPKFTYDLPSFGYKVLPTYQPAKAIDINLSEDKMLTGNYFKLGGGNYLTPYAEFQLHSTQNKNYSYGASGRHLSANAGNPENADFSDNGLGIFGSKLTRKGDLTGKLNYERHVIHRYGYPDSLEFEKKDIKQVYNDFNGSVFFDNGTIRNKSAYKTGLEFYTFSNGESRENDFNYLLMAEVDLKQKQSIKFGGGVDYTTYSRDTIAYNRLFVRLTPTYQFEYKKIMLSVGLNAVVANDSAKTRFYPFPKIKAEHFLVPDKVKAFAEMGGDVKKNTLRQLAYINPFISENPLLENTVQSFTFNGGLRGVLQKKIDYLLKFEFSNDNNLPLFVSDSSASRPFNVVYDDVQTVAFQSGLGIRIDEKFFVQFASTFYNYSTDLEAQAWQLPAFDLDLNLRYTVAKKLNLRLQLYTLGDRFQKDYEISGNEAKLKPFLDLNLMADYRYKQNISFFVNVNNISNARYQKWYNYPVYGLNALAGVTFSL